MRRASGKGTGVPGANSSTRLWPPPFRPEVLSVHGSGVEASRAVSGATSDEVQSLGREGDPARRARQAGAPMACRGADEPCAEERCGCPTADEDRLRAWRARLCCQPAQRSSPPGAHPQQRPLIHQFVCQLLKLHGRHAVELAIDRPCPELIPAVADGALCRPGLRSSGLITGKFTYCNLG